MFFIIKNKRYLSSTHLKSEVLIKAYYLLKQYKLGAQELAIDRLIQQQYGLTLKDMCVQLLFDLSFYKNNKGDLILMFKSQKSNKIARLITYGNGAIPGSRILQLAIRED